MASAKQKIGVVGVGRMGANIARRLQDVGHDVVAVYDAIKERADELASQLSATRASTLAEMTARSDTVITAVSDDEAMDSIFAKAGGDSLLKGAQGRLFINCATVTPQIHVEIEARAAAAGAMSLEACMASSIPQAREGTLYLMSAGQRAAFERAKPLLQAISSSVRYLGPAGKAAEVKALVNMVMNINTAALAEGLGLGRALGLDLSMLREVFAQTGAASRVLETDGEDMQNRDHDCYFSAVHAAKDSGIALVLAAGVDLSLPLAQATKNQYDRLVRMGKGDLDKSAIAELTFPDRMPAAG